MIKTIEIREGLEIRLTNDSLWMEEYRDQFGQDILPVLMPLILGVSNSISALAEEAGTIDEIDIDTVLKVLGSESMIDIGLRLASFEITDIHRIMWAMAKAYDEDVPELKRWLRDLAGPEHESLPLFDKILPAIMELVISGVISRKNWERLSEEGKKLKDSRPLQPKTKKKTKK